MPALLPSDFALTGLFATPPSDQPITGFQVLGERSSGTNFVKRLLGRNSALAPSEALGWKHGFPHALAIPPGLAVIGVVRRADDWALSMFAKPWHTTPAMQELPFGQFIQAPWTTVVDRAQYFGGKGKVTALGQPMQLDRHPLTGATFDNIFALRRAKLRALLSYRDRGCPFVLVRMEAARNDPQTMLDALLAVLQQPERAQPFRPVFRRLGSRFLPATENARPPVPKHVGKAGMSLLRDTLDLKLETKLGYDYGEQAKG